MIPCLKNVVKTYTSKSLTEILTWYKMGSLRLSPWEGLSALLTGVIGNPLLETFRGRQCGVCDLVLWLFTRGCTVQTLSLDTRFFPGFLRSGLGRWVFTNSPIPSLPPGLSGNPSPPTTVLPYQRRVSLGHLNTTGQAVSALLGEGTLAAQSPTLGKRGSSPEGSKIVFPFVRVCVSKLQG